MAAKVTEGGGMVEEEECCTKLLVLGSGMLGQLLEVGDDCKKFPGPLASVEERLGLRLLGNRNWGC